MCGRYSLAKSGQVRDRFQINLRDGEIVPRFNIAPTQEVPVILNDGKGSRLTLFRWGLVPFWAKEAAGPKIIINARAETVAEKSSFRPLLQRKRCLIIADGFYEWKKDGAIKRPYRISLNSGEVFAFAGLWDAWTSPWGDTINTCAIITTAPNSLVEPLHDRMPVILSRETENIWLDFSITDSLFLKSLLVPFPSDQMTANEVSPLVNNPKNDDPACLIPVTSQVLFE
ncbi:MAG: SOS response-associated peptidase [Bacillota bacterium]